MCPVLFFSLDACVSSLVLLRGPVIVCRPASHVGQHWLDRPLGAVEEDSREVPFILDRGRFLFVKNARSEIFNSWLEIKSVCLQICKNPYSSQSRTRSDLVHWFCLCSCWGGGRAPPGIVGEEPDAHYQAQPGGLDGDSHLRPGNELHGRPGETLALRPFTPQTTDHRWLLILHHHVYLSVTHTRDPRETYMFSTISDQTIHICNILLKEN